ncbi:MAG: alpha-amylase [Desulfurococcaceae archaeon]
MVHEQTFTEALKDYLAKARWWPWKGSPVEVEIASVEETKKLVFLLIKAGELLFQLPLMRVNSIPGELANRGFCLKSECYIEAEYTTDYLLEFVKLRNSRYVNLQTSIDDIKVLKSQPLTLESTNTIASYESTVGALVLKSYRLLPDINIEAKMLERLTKRKYKYIPQVHGLLYYDKYVSGILMNYIKGIGDGGAPFFTSLQEHLEGRKESHEIGLASKIGVIIGEMHIALNTGSVDDFFGVETVSDKDVSMWITRMERMYSEGLGRIDNLLTSFENAEREELEYWRNMAEQAETTVHDAIAYMEKYGYNLYKARTHQDLHLAQMIYVGDGKIDFVITDFEGEPGRNREERLAKEPLLRDIASMIRSYHYLSHASLMNKFNLSRHRASILMMKNDPTFNWRIRHVIAMTYSYLATVHKSSILGVDENMVIRRLWLHLYQWIVERALYEFFYESLYRPLWISIPITGLLEARKYLLFPDL